MRILMFTQDFAPGWLGGVAVFVENICDQLHARGHTVKVLARTWTNDQKVDVQRNYLVHRYHVLPRMASIIPICITLVHAMLWQPDIIFMGHFMTTFALSVVWLWKILRIPYVILVHGLDLTLNTVQGGKVDRILGKIVLRNASLIFANSRYTKGVVLKAGGGDGKVKIINPIVFFNVRPVAPVIYFRAAGGEPEFSQVEQVQHVHLIIQVDIAF